MSYEFLKDGTPFNALSLTKRFDALTADVNTITADAIQFLGLGPEQLPSFVGDPTDAAGLTSENTSATVTTPSTSGSPLEIDGAVFAGVNSGGYKTYPTAGFSHQLQNVGSFLSASSTITSLFVLANVEVRKFEDVKVVCGGLDGRVQEWGISLNEYEWDATVILELESNSGIKGYLPRTERQVSPRVTIGAAGNSRTPDPPEEKTVSGETYLQGRIAMSPLRDYPGHSTGLDKISGLVELPLPVVQQFDHRTHQDVSIRTVITRDDLSRLVNDAGDAVTLPDVKHIRFGFASLNNRRYSVQRANITVLPLLAEVK